MSLRNPLRPRHYPDRRVVAPGESHLSHRSGAKAHGLGADGTRKFLRWIDVRRDADHSLDEWDRFGSAGAARVPTGVERAKDDG